MRSIEQFDARLSDRQPTVQMNQTHSLDFTFPASRFPSPAPRFTSPGTP